MKENFKLKLKLQHFAPARVDDNGYSEGETVGDYILLNVNKQSWLENGVTATVHNMSNVGKVEIPIVSGERPTPVGLCEAGVKGTQSTRKEDLKIDTMVYESFDGCFTTAGIADKNTEKALNTVKLKKLAEAREEDILADLVTNATASTLNIADYTNNISSFIVDLKTEFRKLTNVNAVNMFCSSDILGQLTKERLVIPTDLGDAIFVNDYEGRVLRMNVILNDEMDADILLTVPEAIHVGNPTNVKSLDAQILGGFENLANINFSSGVITKYETEKGKLAIETDVFIPYGMLTIPEFALVYKTAVVPAPTPQQLLQEAQKEAENLKKEALEQAKLEAEKIKLEAEQLKLEAEQETKEETKNKKEK